MKRFLLFSAVWLLPGSFLMGQTTFQEQAARLQNINAYLLDFRPAGAPWLPEENTFEVVFDLNPQPTIDTRVGTKDEPIDPPSLVPKLRARYLWSSGLMVGAAYAPGIELEDYEADFISLELGYRFELFSCGWAVRASYSDGDVTGPITEPNVKDFFEYKNQGFDLSGGKSFGALYAYGFLGRVETETSLDIEIDGVHLDNEDDALYGGLGATWSWRSFGFTLEQNFTDDYLKNLILSVSYRL
jgi:hypothetical protein